jgi:hypothetical protein
MQLSTKFYNPQPPHLGLEYIDVMDADTRLELRRDTDFPRKTITSIPIAKVQLDGAWFLLTRATRQFS